MKVFYRILAILLVMLSVFSFVACSGKRKTNTSDSNPTNEPVPSESAEPTETPPCEGAYFNGETVKFFVNVGQDRSAERSIAIGEDDDPTYEVNVMTNERNKLVEEALNVKIELAGTCSMQGADDVLKPILQSHIYTYDVVCLYQYFDLGLALGDTVGSFYNYSNMLADVTNYINLDAKYWSQAVYNTLSLNDTGFFLTGDLAQSYVGAIYVSYVNARLWNEYAEKISTLENNPKGYTSIYDIVNNGYWTLDLWMELADMAYIDSNSNDKKDYTDQAGLISYDNDINNLTPNMLACGSGIIYSKLDEVGKPVINIYNQKNLAFAEKLYQLYVESDTVSFTMPKNEDGDTMHIMEIFANCNALLATSKLDSAEYYLSDMKDDFYVMPLPMFDHDQYDPESASRGYKTQLHDSLTQFAICKDIGDERIPVVTATMELMAFYSKQLVTPAYYDKAIKDRYTRSPQDAAIVDMIREGVYTDFATAWSSRLGNITWHFRNNYDSRNRAAELKKLGGTASYQMKTLMKELEEAFWVE